MVLIARRTLPCAFLVLVGYAAAQPVISALPFEDHREREDYQRLLRRLKATTATIAWERVSLRDVVKDLGRRLDASFLLAPPLAERADEEVSLDLASTTMASLVGILAENLGVAFQHRHGIVYVTTPADAVRRAIVLELHAIADLLYRPPDFPAPATLDLRPSGVTGLGEEEAPEPEEGPDPARIVELVRQITGEEQWAIEGTSIDVSGRTLIVRHTPEMQRKVRRAIEMLRGAL